MSYWPSFILILAWSILFSTVSGNWDENTGALMGYLPNDEWLAKYRPAACTPPKKPIQCSECARNTRLAWPLVQLFATFVVIHDDDGDHGCPYGHCCAYTVVPGPEVMRATQENGHSYFWHKTGGVPGTRGTHPIANPQTGEWGWEDSSGTYHDGEPNTGERQNGHDNNYPNIEIPAPWPPIDYPPSITHRPLHPLCAYWGMPNKDPGQNSKRWIPARTEAYPVVPPTLPLPYSRGYRAGPGSSYLSPSRLQSSNDGLRRPVTSISPYYRPMTHKYGKILRSRKRQSRK